MREGKHGKAFWDNEARVWRLLDLDDVEQHQTNFGIEAAHWVHHGTMRPTPERFGSKHVGETFDELRERNGIPELRLVQ